MGVHVDGNTDITRAHDSLLVLSQALFQCLPHRVLSRYACTELDVLAAIPYLIHFPLPVLFAVYILSSAQRRQQLGPFLWCAGMVNFLAVVVQLLYQTGPV